MYKRQLNARRAGFTVSVLALAIAATTLWAADEHVEVIGQAASIDQALKEQRRSDSVQSTVHADGVAQLPDQNVAEATQRLPGVSVERDQGEAASSACVAWARTSTASASTAP